jgi:hypothetical protein
MEPGSPLAITGAIDAEIYAPAGSDSRINWRVTVDAVLSAKAKRKPKETLGEPSGFRPAGPRKDPADGKAHAAKSWAAPVGSMTITSGASPRPSPAPFDASIPFAAEWR